MIYSVSEIYVLFKEISYPEDSRPCSNQMLVGTDKTFGTLITNHISDRHMGSCIQKKSSGTWAIMETDFEDWIQLGCMNDVFFIFKGIWWKTTNEEIVKYEAKYNWGHDNFIHHISQNGVDIIIRQWSAYIIIIWLSYISEWGNKCGQYSVKQLHTK